MKEIDTSPRIFGGSQLILNLHVYFSTGSILQKFSNLDRQGFCSCSMFKAYRDEEKAIGQMNASIYQPLKQIEPTVGNSGSRFDCLFANPAGLALSQTPAV